MFTLVKSTSSKIILFILAVFILSIILYFIFFENNENYIFDYVKRGDIQEVITASGILVPYQMLTIGAQVSGQITKLYVYPGEYIREGTIIAEIDSTNQENELLIKKAQLKKYSAKLNSAKVSLEIAKKKLTREKILLKQSATSQESMLLAKESLAKAEAELQDVLSLMTQSEIEVNIAQSNLNYTKIKAPISGTIISIPVKTGQTINASQITPIIAYMADLKRYKLEIQISEADITKVSTGMNVKFSILSDISNEYNSQIDSIDIINNSWTNNIENKNNSNKNDKAIYYNAFASIDNTNDLFKINMTASCEIILSSSKDVMMIPLTSLLEQDGDYYVRVLSPHKKAILKKIQVGLRDDVNIEVKSGLSLGEEIIVQSITDKEIKDDLDKYE